MTEDIWERLVKDYTSAHHSGDPETIKTAQEAIADFLMDVKLPERPEPFHEDTVVEINVQSGKIIMSDDLRKVKKYDIDMAESINYGRGCDTFSKQYAEINVAYASVGNSCPSITVNADGVIQFVSPEWDEATDSAIFEGGEVYKGHIITDLWAVMAVDYQQWLDDGGQPVEEANAEYPTDPYTVLDVTPGKYRWTVFSHNDSFNGWADGRLVYAKLELI